MWQWAKMVEVAAARLAAAGLVAAKLAMEGAVAATAGAAIGATATAGAAGAAVSAAATGVATAAVAAESQHPPRRHSTWCSRRSRCRQHCRTPTTSHQTLVGV